jgi:hypothetical protein
MQRIALFFVALFVFTVAANAQNNGTTSPARQMLSSPEAFADGHLAALDKQLGLSEEQKTPLRAVFLQEGKQLIAILDDNSLSDAQKLTCIHQIHVAARNRVWTLLTHDQYRRRSGHPPPAVLVTDAQPLPAIR